MNDMSSRDFSKSFEPLAIIGIGCHLPGGVHGPRAFWDMLCNKACGIIEVPDDRWNSDAFYDPDPNASGKAVTKWGGFVPDIALFDANFFGISPREAELMDPQQRAILHVTWEALEDAGVAPDRIAGSNTGVFVGVSVNDYALLQRYRRSGEELHAGTGTAQSIVANRISHRLDLRGPSLAVDTACSSSLVATDIACHSLWNGECSLALAGGVNGMFDPGIFINFSKANMMSPSGVISTFDERANGYVRGEGAGIVVLKPLSRALADGDRVYALILATAVNQDGRTSTITVPSKDAQAAMLREACRRAGVSPQEVGYVEAHGTGTPVGDPIEAAAIGSVFGVGRRDGSSVFVGSGKPNVGHLESAAGVTGLIKTALCVYHGAIAPNRNFETPNPNIPWDEMDITVPQTVTAWDTDGRPRRAAVNSFGFGGTNACAVLEQAPSGAWLPLRAPEQPAAGAWLVPLSAASPDALRTRAQELRDYLVEAGTAVSLADVAGTAALRRAHLGQRLAVVAKSNNDLVAKLDAFASEDTIQFGDEAAPDTIISGRAESTASLVFVFSGQGGQWWAMGRRLLETDPLFRREIERFDQIFRDIAGWSAMEVLVADEESSRVHETEITQPAIFAVQVALAARWRAWGVEPDAVLGHSLGEVAAAHVCGALSLEDAARVIHHRGRLQAETEGLGGIAAIGLTRGEAEDLLTTLGEDRLEIAAVNGSAMVNLAGDAEALDRLIAHLEAEQPDVFVRRIKMNFAPHSFQMDRIKEPFLASLEGMHPQAPLVPFISTVTGAPHDSLDADYWWRNIREPVLFQKAIESANEAGHTAYLEIGPHATLAGLITGILAERGTSAAVVPSLDGTHDDLDVIHAAQGALYVHGVQFAWETLVDPNHRFVELPPYPWEKQAFWRDSEEAQAALQDAAVHPLLGHRKFGPRPAWENEIDLQTFPYINDHQVDGSTLFPATGYLEMILAAARDVFGDGPLELEDVTFHEAMILGEDQSELLETVFDPDRGRISIYSRARGRGTDWTLRASARARQRPMTPPRDDGAWPEPDENGAIERTAFYRLISQSGFDYGPNFQGVETLWPDPTETCGRVTLAETLAADKRGYLVHPALFDGCLQVSIGLIGAIGDEAQDKGGQLVLPVSMSRVRLFDYPGPEVRARARLVSEDPQAICTDLTIASDDGEILLSVEGFACQPLAPRAPKTNGEKAPLGYYRESWEALALDEIEPAQSEPGTWLIFADESGLAAPLAAALEAAGHRCIQVHRGQGFARRDAGDYEIRAENKADMERLFAAITGLEPALSKIVYLWGLDAAASGQRLTAQRLLAAQSGLCAAPLHLAQCLAENEALLPRIWIVTAGLRAIDQGAKRPRRIKTAALTQAPLAGLARTILSEFPQHKCSLVDIDAKAGPAACDSLLAEFLAASDESEVVLRKKGRYVNRLNRARADEIPPLRIPAVSEDIRQDYRLTMTAPGVLDNLTVVETDQPSPGPGEVAIDVQAVGLNFRDIMAATGLLPADAEEGESWDKLGLECSGPVRAVGEGVANLRPGDRVMAVAKGCFRSTIVIPAGLAYPMPSGTSFQEAATIPSVFLTAYYALVTQARLKAGERVLIHVATGGVGLAAIQIARMVGAEIFATAGSDRKRDYLRDLGITHVMDSRSLDFADEIIAATGGQGVDVVLNSLPGPYIEKGFDVLAPYGRFLEIGKRDVYADSAFGLRALRNNVSLYVIDLARMGQDRPELVQDAFRDLIGLFETETLSPLPRDLFPMSRAADAFRHMSQAKHIGKVVVGLDDPDLMVARVPERPVSFRRDGTYLVTGGLGGFGLAVARWMAEHGAGHLVLLGRSGAATDEAQEAITAMQGLGAEVMAVAADATKLADLRRVVRDIPVERPLRGVIHGAMVIDDGLITQLDQDRFARVLAPKVAGAWNLHQATRKASLDFFVMFSSMAAVLGSTGQANYVAANAFLESFADYRRRLDLPALTVNWGALGGVGFVSRNEAMARYLESMGMPAVSLEDALGGLGRLLCYDAPSLGYARIDWQKAAKTNRQLGTSMRLGHLAETADGGATARIRIDLLAAPAAARPAILAKYLTGQVARVLKVDPSKIEAERPLNELGLDSLTAFELKNRIESELAIKLPVGKFLQNPTAAALAEAILEHLAKEPQVTEAGTAGAGQSDILSPRQEWLWRLLKNSDERLAYHREFERVFCDSVRPRLDLKRLQQALDEVVQRHPLLRAAYPEVDGAPSVTFAERHPLGIESHDATALSESAFRALLQEASEDPIDVENGPLYRVRIFHRPDDRDVILLKVYHGIIDGWSNMLHIGQLFAGYYGLSDIQDLASAGEPARYTDFARWQRDLIENDEGAAHLDYWRERLGEPGPLLSLPFDGPRPAGLVRRGANRSFIVDADTSGRVMTLAAAAKTSSYAVLLAAFKALVQRHSGCSDVPVTTVAACRMRPEFEQLVGWFSNNVIVRSAVDSGTSFRALLDTVTKNLRGALAHQEYPIHLVLDAVQGDWHNGVTALDQVGCFMVRPDNLDDAGFGVLMLGIDGAKMTFGNIEIETIALQNDGCTRDLTLYVQEHQGQIYGTMNYNADLFEPETIDDFVADYLALLAAAIQEPDRSLPQIAPPRADAQIPVAAK